MNLLLSTKNRPPTVPKSSNIRDITAYSILMQPGHVIPLDFPEKPYLHYLLVRHPSHKEILLVFIGIELDTVRHFSVCKSGYTLS